MTFLVSCVLTAAVFFGIALYVSHRKSRMNFFSGEEISEEALKDLKGYNRVNVIMWSVCGVAILVCGIMGMFNIRLAGWLLLAICVGCLLLLSVAHSWIEKKYIRR